MPEAHAEPDPKERQDDGVRDQAAVEVDHRDRHEKQGEYDRHQALPTRTKSPGDGGDEQRCHELDDRVTRGDRRLAGRAAPAEHQVAQHGNVLPGRDLHTAGRAARTRHDEIETPLRQIRRGRLGEFGALCTPLAFHHDGQAIDDYVDETADQERESECDGDENRGRLGEQFEHALTPVLGRLSLTKTASGVSSERRFIANRQTVLR
jgi:hypothetical protein